MSAQQDISSLATSQNFFLIQDISITDVKKVDSVELFIDGKFIDTKWEKSDKIFRTSIDPSKHNFMISDFILQFRRRRNMLGKLTRVRDIHIKLQQHFSGIDPTENSQSVSRKYDDMTVTISFASDLKKVEDSASSSTSLQPTTTAISQICPRFRILVIGNTGVGKSTLINKVSRGGGANSNQSQNQVQQAPPPPGYGQHPNPSHHNKRRHLHRRTPIRNPTPQVMKEDIHIFSAY